MEDSNNKRIAKNTFLLYVRMLITIAVSLYTSRIVLQTLGVSDYGVFSVVGGVIGLLGYVNSFLSGGTTRFLTMALGKGDITLLKRTFSTYGILSIISACLIFILGETIGIWFVINKLNIADERIDASIWVYQCALLSSCLTVIQSPFTASILAHEKMGIYAYMSIFDAIMKLLIVYAILLFSVDKLKMYAVLILIINTIDILVNRLYCVCKFPECHITLEFDKGLFNQIFKYSSWNMLGALSRLMNNYGINILLNIFFGTPINAARAVAMQVNNLANQLYMNFQMASRPQIMKYYAVNDIEEMSSLIINTSKYSALLLFCIVIPLSFNIDTILKLWLGTVPEYTNIFVLLVLSFTTLIAIDQPIGMGLQSVGKMKWVNLTSSMFNISVFPLTYIVLKCGGGPITANVIFLIVEPLILFTDLFFLHRYTGFSVLKFIRRCLMPLLMVAFPSIVLSYLFFLYFSGSEWYYLLVLLIISFISTVFFSIYIGVSADFRMKVLNLVRNKINL